MLDIKTPRVEERNGMFRMTCDILVDGEPHQLWIEVEAKYRDGLCTDRADAYLVAVMQYAMRHHHDIRSELPISAELLYQLSTDLMPILVKNSHALTLPRITATAISEPVTKAPGFGRGISATGMSCGVDSLHVVRHFADSPYGDLKPTHLVFANAGQLGFGEFANKLSALRRKITERFCSDYGYEFVWIDSNVAEFFCVDHLRLSTYALCHCVLQLQRMFSIYHLAANGGYYAAVFKPENEKHECALYDCITAKNFTTRSCAFFIEGSVDRLVKTQAIADWEPARKYLSVCTFSLKNCGHCNKCERTILGLLALGGMELLRKFDRVFDVPFIETHLDDYLAIWLIRIAVRDHFMQELSPQIRKMITLKSFLMIPGVLRDKMRWRSKVRRARSLDELFVPDFHAGAAAHGAQTGCDASGARR